MKHMTRSIARLALGCAALLAAAMAWAIPPESYTAEPVELRNVPFIDCSKFGMDFFVMADWDINEYGKLHFDKEGKIVRVNGFLYNSNAWVWNSEYPDNKIGAEATAMEHTHFTVLFDENEVAVHYRENGVFWAHVVPGYGMNFVHAGQMEFVWDWDLLAWVPVKFTPNQGGTEESEYVTCLYFE